MKKAHKNPTLQENNETVSNIHSGTKSNEFLELQSTINSPKIFSYQIFQPKYLHFSARNECMCNQFTNLPCRIRKLHCELWISLLSKMQPMFWYQKVLCYYAVQEKIEQCGQEGSAIPEQWTIAMYGVGEVISNNTQNSTNKQNIFHDEF